MCSLPLECLVSMLRMSIKYDVDDAQTFAKDKLEAHTLFSPAFRLNIARQFDLKDWRKVAASELVHLQPALMSAADYQLIGYETVRLLFRLHHDIDTHRRSLAWAVPSVIHSPFCDAFIDFTNNNSCSAGLEAIWSEVARALLRAEAPLSPQDVLDMLGDVEVSGMDRRCFEKTLERLRRGSAAAREDKMRRSTAESIANLTF